MNIMKALLTVILLVAAPLSFAARTSPMGAEEVSEMRARLLRSALSAPGTFDAAVDGVSSATITSAVIMDAVGQGQSLLRELSDRGYLKD